MRRNAIFTNYRSILDISPKGGYGTLYGPNIDAAGNDTLGEGKIAGTEYLAYADDGSGRKNVTMMVQVPASFDQGRPCIVTAASSGSRGVYGAIGSAGEWGLKHGCAVAYTDKGTGMGTHDLATNTVNVQNGTRADAATAGTSANFSAALDTTALAAINAAFPNRVAFKHAHSQQNPEKDWGNDTLNAIRFAFYVLNEQFAPKAADGRTTVKFKADNTIVIASSVSNGGASAIAAAEQDTEGLIDGVAVGEPVLEQAANPGLIVRQGSQSLAGGGKALLDYYTLANLYQPCATLSTRAAGSPGPCHDPPERCSVHESLRRAEGERPADRGHHHRAGRGSDGHPAQCGLPAGIQCAACVALPVRHLAGRGDVRQRVRQVRRRGQVVRLFVRRDRCHGQADGDRRRPARAGLRQRQRDSADRDDQHRQRQQPGGTAADRNLGFAVHRPAGLQCRRRDLPPQPHHRQRRQCGARASGIREILRTANLRGKPAVIVAGRADTQVPVPFNARPYFGQNRIVEGAASKLSYIEVLNAQHFDAFIDNAAFPGYDSRYVPLHYYFIQALDSVWANLTQGSALPPSQVVRTTPRGGAPGSAPAVTKANVPRISAAPPAADQITYSNNVVTIPD